MDCHKKFFNLGKSVIENEQNFSSFFTPLYFSIIAFSNNILIFGCWPLEAKYTQIQILLPAQ